MHSKKIVSLLAVTAMTTGVALESSAHGYNTFPPSRAHICDVDGGYYAADDGSRIPNAACRQAFLESGAFQFYQKPEFAKLVADYNNIDAVKAAIPGTTLCNANDPAKAGTSLPHPDWQKTTIDTSINNGVINFTFAATAPHDPSFWEFYLSKPGFDSATQALSWDDLDLIQETPGVAISMIGTQKSYEIDLQLPTNRTGDAILFVRWQRIDAAGEAFYNCSDITFAGGDVVTPTWNNRGAFIGAQDDAVAGDEVWARVFNATGQEVVFEKLAIDASNEAEVTWAAELAAQVNAASTATQVGVLSADGSSVTYDSMDTYANTVYSTDANYNFQLDIRPPVIVVNTPPVANATATENAVVGDSVLLNANATDADGDLLSYQWVQTSGPSVAIFADKNIVAQPAINVAGTYGFSVTVSDGTDSVVSAVSVVVKDEVIVNPGTCTDPDAVNYPAYVAGQTYTNQTVNYEGLVYKANWWTSATPGSDGSWTLLSVVNLPWDAATIYQGGTEVDYGTDRYKAAYWTQGNNPADGGPWSIVGAALGCN